MRRLLFATLLLLLATSLFAGERVRRYTMQDSTGNSPQEPTWVSVDSLGSRSVWFFLNNSSGHLLKQNTGFSTVNIRIDTLTTDSVAANLDTINVTMMGLVWDPVDEQYEEPSRPVSGDTVKVRTQWRWSVTHSDDKYQISKVLNFRTGFDAIKLTLATSTASVNKTDPFRFNASLDVTENP